jgi:3-dehydroquinate synthase
MFRGVKWIFFPTTLLAQGDSCIGSKTSINFGKFKNQVGGFYPPNKIYVDPKFLNTLPFKELQSGLGEMAHYFVVAGEEDFDRYKRDYAQALVDKNVLRGVIARSLEIKKSYIEIDEYDKNEKGYNFSVIKILGRYYAIMTNNFKNGNTTAERTFFIGDVKAIFSSTQEINNYAGWYFMANKTKQPVTLSYNVIGNYIDYNVITGDPFIYYKK